MSIEIYRDGEVAEDYMPPELTIVEAAAERVTSLLTSAAGAVALQVRMATYDAVHGTNYRHIRNQLYREKRNHEFESRIGIVAVNR